ncbi:unnamed protein product, partial [Rotaria sp. Silwood1]
QKYIEQRSQNERVVMVVSGRLGQAIVPSIHKIRQIISIYVYCIDKERNKQWAVNFPKVKAAVVQLDELVSRIKDDYKIQKIVEEPLSINTFTTGSGAGKATSGVNGKFVFSQALIDCLLRLKSTERDTKELIEICKKEYEDNDKELSNLREFRKNYSPNEVLRWYTRESFFYKTLNAVLRTENIHMIFLFRAFISDIQRQLKNHQTKNPLQVYRGQKISTDELKILKQFRGQFISVNSFFSTSTDYRQALKFLKGSNATENLEPVLFEIVADPNVATTKPFADISAFSELSVSLRASSTDIHPNAKWAQNGIIVAGGNGEGNGTNQLSYPCGLYVDDDQTIYVADCVNHRIMEWKSGATNGKVVAGANGYGNGAHQLSGPVDVIIDKESDSLIISDGGNNRVVRWPRRNGTSGKTIISNIYNSGLTMDENGSLYVVDEKRHEVRRYKIDDTKGTVVAGGNGKGNRLDQLSLPSCVFLDRDHSVYVSDCENHRVMKWEEDATQGIVVAGGQGKGNSLTQLKEPDGVVVDQLGTVYVADFRNYRIMSWPKGATQGSVIVGGNGKGAQPNQFRCPACLSFDRHGNLYVVDWGNQRVQKFNIE